MPYIDDPCRYGHPELKLMIEVTTFRDRLPVMHCNRCGAQLGFEEAVRNDERIKWAAEFDRAAAWHRDGQGGGHRRAAIGYELAAEQLREALKAPELEAS